MADYKKAYLREMDRKGIKYREVNDRVVSVVYGGENLSTIKILVIFNKDGEHLVQLACSQVANFKNDRQFAKAIFVCNQLNERFRWCRFYVDDDRDVMVDADAIVDIDSVGTTLCELVSRMVNVVDDAYVEIMKIKLL